MEEVSKSKQVDSNYRLAVLKDFDNPACMPFTKLPMSQLTEPKFTSGGGSCWHIFTHRYYNEDTKLPLTLESYEDSKSIHYWKSFFAYLGIFSLVVVAAFGLIALIYKIGCWIFAGFKK